MKEIKRQVTTEEIVYEVTAEELENIKKRARYQGRRDVIEYLKMAMQNYRYAFNLYGLVEFVSDLTDFLSGASSIIPNTKSESFYDYIKKKLVSGDYD